MSNSTSNTAKKSLRSEINNNWKKETFSMSALVRYAKGKGKNDVEKLLQELNEKNGTNIKIGQLTTKKIVENATIRELHTNIGDAKNYKKGDKKTKFSFWLVILTLGRMSKKASK